MALGKITPSRRSTPGAPNSTPQFTITTSKSTKETAEPSTGPISATKRAAQQVAKNKAGGMSDPISMMLKIKRTRGGCTKIKEMKR